MKDPLNVDLKDAEFNIGQVDGNDEPILIRWGAFESQKDGSIKIAAFKVGMMEAHFSKEAGKDITVESDKIVLTEEAQNGAQKQAYEWIGDGFESVDIEEQNWFKF